MSLTSEQSHQPLVTSVFLDAYASPSALSQALLDLNRCASIYRGDVDAATAAIAYSAVKNLGLTSCQVWLYADSRTAFKPVAHYGSDALSQPVQIAEHADYFENLGQQDWLVVNTAEAIHQAANRSPTDISVSWPPYLRSQQPTITALIEVPIHHDQQIVGVLCCVQHHAPRVWQAAEKSFALTAACLIALAISHASQQQKTKALNKQDHQLKLANIERQQAEQAWQESQRFIRGILDASSNILYVNNFASGTNYYVNGYMENILGYSPDEIQQFGAHFLERLAHPHDINTIQQARQQLAQSQSGDVIENEYRLQHKQGHWHWLLCRETIFQWNPDGTPLQLLGTATDITMHKENTAALQQQNQELTALARVDALTQIANRRVFDEFLRNAWMSHNQTPLTLILCDIDYFKLYNDTYGHQAGDECLRLVAQALQKAVKRQPDLVARYGGEEFAVVLPNTALVGAQYVAQAIQTSVQELKIEHRLSTVSTYLTVSLGIATVASTTNGSPQELISAADQGLYQAKSDGRAQFSVGQLDIPVTNF
ncbi:diguanylate cyclase domain-containing protein [Leptolyngbya sp. Heron Island J]|uniref:diguanylate cyclase domain-containing protein n=1 Tax=Leptolyngbya sp. Heron Island J TaxID=1385935 RepID=UPI0003B9432E|nr:diguanylate cyclase [Leptolyngbya sp. Heron Island J]ESA34952.1 diguanylate cyclase domain-containing protein [Leptolyngbya sp. Heron Island J]